MQIGPLPIPNVARMMLLGSSELKDATIALAS